MTKRRHISTRDRVSLFARKGGVCFRCGAKVEPGQGWDLSHVIPLAMGGADDETNWDVEHTSCHRAHTAETDIPQIAKAKRREARHIGAKAPSRTPLPYGRKSAWKKRIDGTVIRRGT